MIYNSLDIIPYKTFLKVLGTGNVSLLSDDDKAKHEDLVSVWEKLHEEHLNKQQSPEAQKTFITSKEIDFLKGKYKIVLMACDSLRFDVDDDLIDLLRDYGYTIRTTDNDTYHNDLDQIERETDAYEVKINRLKDKLPKRNDNEEEYDIDDVMASYSAILGFDFDYNTITYTKFYGLQKQVQSKIKAFESQNVKGNE